MTHTSEHAQDQYVTLNINPSTLTDYARSRLQKGFLCYWRPDDESVTAICVDLNVYASGNTVDLAKIALNFVISETVEIAIEDDSLDDLLKRGPNPSTLWNFRVTCVAFTVVYGAARVVIFVIRVLTAVKGIMAPRPPFGTWQEHLQAA